MNFLLRSLDIEFFSCKLDKIVALSPKKLRSERVRSSGQDGGVVTSFFVSLGTVIHVSFPSLLCIGEGEYVH